MQIAELQELLQVGLPEANIQVASDDQVHFSATIISPQFVGLTPVKRQQLVYALVAEHIQSGAVHALSLQTYTPEQWDNNNKRELNNG